jgi:hypothetical protein
MMMRRGSFLTLLAWLAAMLAPPSFAQSLYAVDGVALGERVDLDELVQQSYACKPSEDYPGFTWCKRVRTERRSSGPLSVSSTIVFGADGAVAYVNKDVFPVFLEHADIADEIDRLSRRLKSPPRVHPVVRRPGNPPAGLVSWGGLVFAPIERDRRDMILQGMPARAGILVAQTPSFLESAREGFPIYRLEGRPGFAYVASLDAKGQGSVRYFAMDPSRLARSEPQAASPSRSEPVPSGIAAAEAEKARAEAERAKAEAEKAKAEAEKARAEAEKLRAQAEIARWTAERAKPEEPAPKVNVKPKPEDQERFISAVASGRDMFAAAQNEQAAGGARTNRKSAICSALASMSVRQWQGAIALASTNGDGKGVLVVRIAPDVGLKTWGGADAESTFVEPDSAVFKQLGSLKQGDPVLFSGSFVGSDADCVRETSLTIARSMQQPEFVFRFSEISRIADN